MENQKPMVETTYNNFTVNKLAKKDECLLDNLQHNMHLWIGGHSNPVVNLYQLGDQGFMIIVVESGITYSFVFNKDHRCDLRYTMRAMECKNSLEHEYCECIFRFLKTYCEFEGNP